MDICEELILTMEAKHGQDLVTHFDLFFRFFWIGCTQSLPAPTSQHFILPLQSLSKSQVAERTLLFLLLILRFCGHVPGLSTASKKAFYHSVY